MAQVVHLPIQPQNFLPTQGNFIREKNLKEKRTVSAKVKQDKTIKMLLLTENKLYILVNQQLKKKPDVHCFLTYSGNEGGKQME